MAAMRYYNIGAKIEQIENILRSPLVETVHLVGFISKDEFPSQKMQIYMFNIRDV